MSIKKKLSVFFTLLVLCILLANNTLHYIRSKNRLIEFNKKEITLVTEEIAYEVENSKNSASYMENRMAQELRTASVAIQDSLPADYHDVSNDELKRLAKKLMISHITLLAPAGDDIIGVKSSDPKEINMSTKEWGYWYTSFRQLLSQQTITTKKGVTLPHFWSGPIEVASSNPNHIDKWGYYYDGSTNYIIDPYFRDRHVLDFEKRFGPTNVMNRFTENLEGVLELTVFNPKNFGKRNQNVYLNGNKYIKIKDQPIWYGTYTYRNTERDKKSIQEVLKTGKSQSYLAEINHKKVLKTLVPIKEKNTPAYVIGVVYDYGLIEKELQQELIKHLLLSLPFIFIVLIISFIFSTSITRPIKHIMEHVNQIAKGNFGKVLNTRRKDELGGLVANINHLSHFLKTYVDDLKKSQEESEYHAYHDFLTGLPNRRYFKEQLNRRLIESKEKSIRHVAVLFMDIDRFKDINDTLGHSKGDQLIQLIANRIKECLPSANSFLTRQGGDEFVILFSDFTPEEVKGITEKIMAYVQQPCYIDNDEVFVSISSGLSFYPEHSTNLDTLITYADVAMYASKRQGGSKVSIYHDSLNKKQAEKVHIETRLRKAIQKGDIDVYYQPKIEAKRNVITGVEALVRWNDAELGFVSPEAFIPIAEEAGLIQYLWEVVMKKACSQVSEWNKVSDEKMTLAVNFSPRQFQDPVVLVNEIKHFLSLHRFDPAWFEMEITESTLLMNAEETIKALHLLKKYGISISIDDFGTGYSSLSYLKKLPIDCLKIDRSFIQDIQEDYSNSEIAQAIISLSQSLKLEVIAEGVEEEYQKAFLMKNGCDHMQGYLFSKPLAAEDFEEAFLNS
ncbi:MULTISPECIES: EAL domain-containing protein [Priestia]|uniref:GGDEF domain-containing protein n=2 Tax=Priestia megaterium TaxID=1404 RepID=A0AAE5P7X7_PRIMG|nr:MULTISPECIES: EAL domain-containing protein [Priestia]MCU7765371.1 EAL domain-containing protein [Priestia megaterium]PES37185.1 GGDEF domain-containing protein [Priestia megaterium]PFI64361.1 GGDEF domain-containing protein [Priestia megaterium]PFT58400.1 GGDEF domain-containing protein [Priestia megaterium]PGK56646.1 GGDEF domain-containing protein [Priestia megaterium]